MFALDVPVRRARDRAIFLMCTNSYGRIYLLLLLLLLRPLDRLSMIAVVTDATNALSLGRSRDAFRFDRDEILQRYILASNYRVLATSNVGFETCRRKTTSTTYERHGRRSIVTREL